MWVIFLIILGAFSSRNHHTSFLEKISFLTDIGVLCIFVGYCIFIKNTSFLLKILVLLYLILFPLAYLRVDYYLNNETFLLWERYKSPLFIIT